MSTAIGLRRPVLIDRLGARNVAVSALYVVAGIALLAGAAQVQIPMWPVPITGQTFAVLLVGASLGPVRATISTVAYVLLAVAGLPILTPQPDGSHTTGVAVFALPTFGYLIGFVIASVVLGLFAKMAWDRHVLKAVISFLVAEAIIYACGLPVLWAWLGAQGYPNGVNDVLSAGFTPYLLGDLIKAVLAGAILPLAWWGINKADSAR